MTTTGDRTGNSLLPPHLHCPIEAEHNLLLTHPDVVVDAVLKWMRQRP